MKRGIWIFYFEKVENSYDVELNISIDYESSTFLRISSFVTNSTYRKSSRSGKLEPAYGLSYFDTIYFIVVTMSTVGYGDITPITPLGKLTMILFIFFGIVIILYILIWLLEFNLIIKKRLCLPVLSQSWFK